jgi:hypothetical protein
MDSIIPPCQLAILAFAEITAEIVISLFYWGLREFIAKLLPKLGVMSEAAEPRPVNVG